MATCTHVALARHYENQSPAGGPTDISAPVTASLPDISWAK